MKLKFVENVFLFYLIPIVEYELQSFQEFNIFAQQYKLKLNFGTYNFHKDQSLVRVNNHKFLKLLNLWLLYKNDEKISATIYYHY